MYQDLSFGFIGGGRITYILLEALNKKNKLPQKVTVADPNSDVLLKIKKIGKGEFETTADNKIPAKADIVFLSVHPPLVKDVMAEIKNEIKAKSIFISLAPVISIEKLSMMLGGFNRVVRMIPNAASIIQQGYNPVAFGKEILPSDKSLLLNLFKHWGEAPEVDEKKLEAYAIVTAMGPTYFWPQWQKLHELGKQFGMADDELAKGMPSMLIGAVNTIYHAGLSFSEAQDLIPVYPLKENEPEIKEIFEKSLTALYQKLSGAAK